MKSRGIQPRLVFVVDVTAVTAMKKKQNCGEKMELAASMILSDQTHLEMHIDQKTYYLSRPKPNTLYLRILYITSSSW